MSRATFKCRCGREVRRPEVVRGHLYCSECAFDETYGRVLPRSIDDRRPEVVRPAFSIRRTA